MYYYYYSLRPVDRKCLMWLDKLLQSIAMVLWYSVSTISPSTNKLPSKCTPKGHLQLRLVNHNDHDCNSSAINDQLITAQIE